MDSLTLNYFEIAAKIYLDNLGIEIETVDLLTLQLYLVEAIKLN